MIFSVSVGFQDIDNPKATDDKSKKYVVVRNLESMLSLKGGV